MDIKIIADNKHNSHKKSFNNNLSALTIIDNATKYKWGFPLQKNGTSTTIIEELNIIHRDILSQDRVLKYIRADDQFVTSEIQAWCDGDIIVGYRQHVLNNNKLDHYDTDNDIAYHIHDLARLTHLQQRVGLQATIINGS